MVRSECELDTQLDVNTCLQHYRSSILGCEPADEDRVGGQDCGGEDLGSPRRLGEGQACRGRWTGGSVRGMLGSFI